MTVNELKYIQFTNLERCVKRMHPLSFSLVALKSPQVPLSGRHSRPPLLAALIDSAAATNDAEVVSAVITIVISPGGGRHATPDTD